MKDAPVWLLQAACNAYAASIDNTLGLVLSTLRIKGKSVVCLGYYINILNFYQSSSLGLQSLVVNKDNDGAKSDLDLLLRYKVGLPICGIFLHFQGLDPCLGQIPQFT